jgi:hypothetical protein
MRLTTSQKGTIAEAVFTAAAIELGLFVLRPACEGGRYDLMIDLDPEVIRVQCKWAQLLVGGVLSIRLATCRCTPTGYVRTTYDSRQIDAIGAYSRELGRCYLIPITEVAGVRSIRLRLDPTANNQALRIHWAHDYELERSMRRHWANRLGVSV